MTYAVRTEQADPRPLAAIRAVTQQQRLGAAIIGALDIVWPVLRQQGVRTGHNVVIYHGSADSSLVIDVGVEILGGFSADGSAEVRPVSTPAGEAAATAHVGEYSEIGAAYAALAEWCAANGRDPAGVNWEVYGDWAEDPGERRTDVYMLLSPRSPA